MRNMQEAALEGRKIAKKRPGLNMSAGDVRQLLDRYHDMVENGDHFQTW